MTKPTLTYFDIARSRGEECRMALALAGIDFVDRRLQADDWKALKPTTPFGSLPILEIPGKPPLAQSNAILEYVGREHGLLPTDSFEAARHVALMAYCEELRGHVSPILQIREEAQKVAARTELATKYLPTWAGNVERQLGDGPFFAGSAISVADVKVYMIMRWFTTGAVDHVSKDVFAPFAKLGRLFAAVADHPGIKAWLARAT